MDPNDTNFCENYKLCKEMIPDWMTRCTKCDISFGEWSGGKGILKEYPDYDCPICQENKLCFEQPQCQHPICSDCFKIIYFGEVPQEIIERRIGKEPIHPYQYILDTTELDYCDLKDPEKYPLTEEYSHKFDIWCNLKECIIEQLCTNKCCLCRIENLN